MTSSWLDTRLGDVLNLQRGFDLPAGDRRPGRFPVVASTGVVGTHSEPMVEGPGVVIGRSGSLGGAQYVTGDFWPLNTTLWVKDFKGNDRRFCYYLLKSLNLQTFNVGSGVPTLNRNHVHPLPVRIPVDVNEQRAIGRILGALDDKIELKRRVNETLEAMARALFKSWFIDFDPVHAKAAGRDPGLPADIAALFPDSFEDSDLGEIPEGWRAGRFGDVSVSPRRSVRPDEISPETPYIALEHMPRRSIALTEWGDVEGLESSKFEFKSGEILFGKLRPYFHKVGVAPVDGVCSTDIVVLTPRAKDWLGFVLGHASSVAFVEYTNSGSTGTKMPRTSWSEMARYPVALPTEEVAKEFSSKVCPLIDKIVLSVHESHTLASLRDTLLPKLLSGELRVKDVDRSMEAHA